MARSLSKGPYVDPTLQKKIAKVKSSGKREVIKTYQRASMVTPEFVGLRLLFMMVVSLHLCLLLKIWWDIN
jgi:small subunit ribosomal protein S19